MFRVEPHLTSHFWFFTIFIMLVHNFNFFFSKYCPLNEPSTLTDYASYTCHVYNFNNLPCECVCVFTLYVCVWVD